MPRMPEQTSQAKREANDYNGHVSRERCLQVAQALRDGKIQPPKTKKGQRLFLGDSGSAPNVANHQRHFPGAELVPHKPGQAPEFLAANKTTFSSRGTMKIDVVSQEGHERTYVFDDADVAVPILSIGLATEDDNDVLFQKRGGESIHLPTRHEIAFEKKHCGYWIKFGIDARILEPPKDPETNTDSVRPGTP